jgi:hypothetical protein
MNSHPAHFTSSGKLRATNCHCNTCRQSVGALFGTWAHVPAELLTISDLAMNTGTYWSSEHVTRKFCRVFGTSLFSPEDGWEVDVEHKEVRITNMYNRELHGKKGKTVKVSVAAMEVKDAKEWVEIVEHMFLDDTVDGGHWFPWKALPMYLSIFILADVGIRKDQSRQNGKTRNCSSWISFSYFVVLFIKY